jgi:uncharacterized protein (TIGR02246 family)
MTVAQPEELATLFADAWNAHDMRRLAGLFAEDADFVNVVGIWWKDRRSIEEAHAFAHRTFFRASQLTVDEVTVKALGPDISTVHVGWTLAGQEEPDGAVGKPRRGILLFVASCGTDGWHIRTAQNTDVVPEAMTVAAKS